MRLSAACIFRPLRRYKFLHCQHFFVCLSSPLCPFRPPPPRLLRNFPHFVFARKSSCGLSPLVFANFVCCPQQGHQQQERQQLGKQTGATELQGPDGQRAGRGETNFFPGFRLLLYRFVVPVCVSVCALCLCAWLAAELSFCHCCGGFTPVFPCLPSLLASLLASQLPKCHFLTPPPLSAGKNI